MTLSNVKRVLAYHTSRLQDKNADVRLKAIKELELLGDVEALPSLRDVYEKDVDVDVRKAAQEAGRNIFLRQQASQK